MTYTLEWTCEHEVESVNGSALPEDYFSGMEFSEPYRPLKRVIARTVCGGVTKINAASADEAIAQLNRVLRGPRKIRLV